MLAVLNIMENLLAVSCRHYKETATVPTNKDNFFERASAMGFLGLKGSLTYHTNAGILYEAEKIDEAYKLIDTAYMKVRNKNLSLWQPEKNTSPHLGGC
jgi:hypothetical protein